MCGGKTPMSSYQYPYGLWSKGSLKQICQSVCLVINRHSQEAHLLVAFYHDFKHFVKFSVNRAD